MYFSNIVNSELQHFHAFSGADFSMSLTDVLNSDLFKVEEIINDNFYRIYPLFYCEKIISSNSKDIILDTHCIILEKTGNETYLSFITDENKDNIILNENFLNIKNIGDTLSTDEFNSLVYRLRQKGALTGSLNFEKNNLISGFYATYQFNGVNGQLRNDSGIIINDKIKNNPLTVKLVNPFFLNAKYTLTFTVRSLTGVNVCEENKDDYILTDTFSIVLVEDTDVSIPINNYVNDDVLDFDVEVNISFDVPEIVNSNFELELSSDYDEITVDDNLTLTATLIGDENVTGYVVQFYENNRLIGTETTDNLGKAILNYSPTTVSNHIYSATVLGLTSEINVIVNKINPTITLETNTNKVIKGNSFTLSGTLSVGSGKTVEIYNGDNLVDTLTTGVNGTFTKTINGPVDVYNYKAKFNGDTKHNSTISNLIKVIVIVSDDYIECTVVRSSLSEYVASSHAFYNADGEKVIFDYGDGTIEVNDMYKHTYTDGQPEHTMKIYNVTNLRNNAFNRCPVSYIKFNNMESVGGIFYCSLLTTVVIPEGVKHLNLFSDSPNLRNINIPSTVTSLSDRCFSEDTSLTSLDIPRSVTSIGIICFYSCTGLEVINFNWETSEEILTYVPNWINFTSSSLKFSIPHGTTQLYIDKGYPSGKLVERSE